MEVKTVASQLEENTVKAIREVVKELKEESTKKAVEPQAAPVQKTGSKIIKKAPIVPTKIIEKPDSRKRQKKDKEDVVEEEVEEQWEDEDVQPPPIPKE
ncbi:MAG: hypothetical protein KKA19_03395 [Candidatus Margulisbacteria bacterium]|nr:hypothetical protein [Candidatus Margulisiibacteriota bacterium]